MTELPRLKTTSAAMEQVDSLGWALGFSLKSYGVRVGIRSNDPLALDRARRHLPSEWESAPSAVVDRIYSILIDKKKSRPGAQRLNLLYGDEVRLARSNDLDSVFETFESDVRLFVAELAKQRVFVHAGVVGWKGKAIVIPGRSYSGKSTLVAELRAGRAVIRQMRCLDRADACILLPSRSSCAKKVSLDKPRLRWLSSGATREPNRSPWDWL